MGQRQSKRVSTTSSQTLLTDYSSPPNSPTSPITLCETITPPAAPREITRISEIIDPRELLNDEIYNVTPTRPRGLPQPLFSPSSPGLQPLISLASPKTPTSIVHSPSGNALGAEEFINHPHRPLAIWERQERVMEATKLGMERFEAESRMGNRSRMGTRRGTGDEVEKGGNRRGGWWCGCWPY